VRKSYPKDRGYSVSWGEKKTKRKDLFFKGGGGAMMHKQRVRDEERKGWKVPGESWTGKNTPGGVSKIPLERGEYEFACKGPHL